MLMDLEGSPIGEELRRVVDAQKKMNADTSRRTGAINNGSRATADASGQGKGTEDSEQMSMDSNDRQQSSLSQLDNSRDDSGDTALSQSYYSGADAGGRSLSESMGGRDHNSAADKVDLVGKRGAVIDHDYIRADLTGGSDTRSGGRGRGRGARASEGDHNDDVSDKNDLPWAFGPSSSGGDGGGDVDQPNVHREEVKPKMNKMMLGNRELFRVKADAIKPSKE
jgi:hypothetical protein